MATSPLDPPASKLTPPRPHQGIVERERLLRELDEATQAASLTLVLCYAGAGKTVLVTSWVAARPETRLAWLSCDTADTDQMRFWTGFVAAIRRTDASVGDDTLDRIELDGAVSVDAVGVLSDELRAVDDPLTIVLDDLHDAADQELWPLLTAFIEWLPAQHRVVIATRSEPALPLHRWRVEGRLAEIRNERLTFDDDEAAAMLESLGARVDRSEVSMLTDRTEGWAAGLQLAGLSVRDRDDTAAYLLDVAATDRNLVDYLTAEVLERQPADVTEFLLATSILRELDPLVCRAITGDARAHERLRDIEERGLFLVPLDRERRRYRYHHLFAELLQRQLHLQGESRELALHQTASDWYEAEGQLDLAVLHAVRAKNPTRAVSLLRERPIGTYLSGAPLHPTRLIDFLDDATLVEERELALEFALNVGINGSLDEASRWIRRLAHLNGQQSDATFRERLTAIQALWEMARGGAERSMAHMIRARDLLDTTDDLAPGLVAAEARNRQYLDDLDGVRRLAHDWPAEDLPPMAAVILLSAHGAIEGDAGFLHIADRVGRSALELADEVGTRRHHGAGEALRVVGSVHLERLELDEAEATLELALRTVERDRPALEVLCLVDHTWLLVERRRIDDAFETIARAATLAERFDMSPALLARVKAASVHLHLLVGATDQAEIELQRMPQGTRRSLAEARVALARHRPTVAEDILDSIETHRWPRYELDLALLRGQTRIALDRPTADVEATIECALGIADEHRFIRSLLNENSDLDDALQRALRRAPSGSHRHAIGQHLRARAPVARALEPRSAQPPPSKRELEILRYLATGLSNREIAAALYISLNTMKTHTRSLYRRLGVSSRSEAVAAGRVRGLL